MKKIFILLSAVALCSSCDWFAFDNQEQYNAKIEGKFIDSKTGQTVQFGNNTKTFQIYQEGYIAPGKDENYGEQSQSLNVKFNGEYRNDLMWAGNYRLQTVQSNFYPIYDQKFKLEKGSNKVDFTVTPYARVIDPKFSYDAANHQIVAKFKVELGKPSDINSVKVNLYGFTDRFVCDAFNKVNDPTSSKNITVNEADGKTEITLSFSTEPNKNNGLFKYDFEKYLRIGVLATGNQVNTSRRYNFSTTWSVAKGFTGFSEITNWEED